MCRIKRLFFDNLLKIKKQKLTHLLHVLKFKRFILENAPDTYIVKKLSSKYNSYITDTSLLTYYIIFQVQ